MYLANALKCVYMYLFICIHIYVYMYRMCISQVLRESFVFFPITSPNKMAEDEYRKSKRSQNTQKCISRVHGSIYTCIYIYICAYAYILKCLDIYTRTSPIHWSKGSMIPITSTYTHKNTLVRLSLSHTLAQTHIYPHTHLHTHTHTHTHSHTHTHTHTHTHIHTHTDRQTDTRLRKYMLQIHYSMHDPDSYVCVCTHVYVCVCVGAHIDMCISEIH